MDRTVKVTGFSLRPCTRLRLSQLFSRVGQVRKVYLSPDKNAAFVQFEYTSTISFVQEQEWFIGRETLNVRPLVRTKETPPPPPPSSRLPLTEPRKEERRPAQHAPGYTYQDYRSARVSLQERALGAAPSKKQRRKRRRSGDGRLVARAPEAQAGKHGRKLKKNRPKRKKRCAYLESAASLPFGVTASASKDTVQVFVRGHTTVPLLVPVSPTATEVLALVSAATDVPSRHLHVTVEGHVLSEQTLPDIKEGSTLHYAVKGLGGADQGGTDEEGERRKKAEELKEDGNKMYKVEKYKAAVALYSVSIDEFPLVVAYNNRAQCYLKLSKWDECISDCDQVLQQEPTNSKALLRRKQAMTSKGEGSGIEGDKPTVVSQQHPLNVSKETSSVPNLVPEQSDEVQTNDRLDQPQSKSARKRMRKKAKKQEEDRLSGEKEQTVTEAAEPHTETQSTSDSTLMPDGGSVAKPAVQSGAGVEHQITEAGEAIFTAQPSTDKPVLHAVSPTSSVDEVTQWLQEVCKLTDDNHLHCLPGLDGQILFDYEDHATFVNDTNIPVGVARKILYLRDNPHCWSHIASWSVREVIEFVGKPNPGHDWSKVEENHIDGAAFMSYTTPDDIMQDFKTKKRIAFQILSRRQNEEKEQQKDIECGVFSENKASSAIQADESKTSGAIQADESKTSGAIQADESKTSSAIQADESKTSSAIQADESKTNGATLNEHQNAPSLPLEVGEKENVVTLKDDDPLMPYKLYLQNALHLQPLKESSNTRHLVDCELRVVYHKHKDLNKLEQQFTFLVLCKPDFCKGRSGKESIEKLWKLMTSNENVCSKWAPLLPESVSKNLNVYDDHTLYFDSYPAKHSKIVEFDRTVRKLDHSLCPVMIIERELLEKGKHGYLVTGTQAKDTLSFPFGFHADAQYWFFSSSDIGLGFERGQMDSSQCGSSPRRRYVDSSSSSDLEDEEQQCPRNADQHGVSSDEQVSTAPQLAESVTGKVESSTGQQLQNITPRPFKEHANTWKYNQGKLEAVESGDDMLNRAVEFKRLNGCSPEDKRFMRAFLDRSFEFVCACLNARKNGTIYFGIAEQDTEDQEQTYDYGQMVGIKMDQKRWSDCYDSFHKSFKKCFRDSFEKVKYCLFGPVFVPIRNTDKCIIEIDIEPAYEQTRMMLFSYNPKYIIDTYGSPGEGEKHKYHTHGDNWTGVFRRDGSETMYVSKAQLEPFRKKELFRLSNVRKQKEETRAQTHRDYMSSPEAEKLKQFISECDESMFPILLLPKLTEEEKANDIHHFEFLYYIQWTAIFDFDNDSDRNGVYSIAKNLHCAFEIHESVASDFIDMSVEDRKETLSFLKETVWLFTNGKATGNNAFERLKQQEWINLYWTYIKNAVAFYKNNSVIPPARRLVLILVSDEMEDGIMETCQDLKTDFGWDHVFFVFQSESVRDTFSRERIFSDDIKKHSVVLPWMHLHHAICQCLKLTKHDENKYVHTSSGADVPIPYNEWQLWSDLDVLNVRECREEWEGSTRRPCNLKAQEEEKKFYQGKPISWWNLFFTDYDYNHVMERSVFDAVMRNIDNKSRNTDHFDLPMVTISHMPGTGGTTLGKSLLWKLKDKFKCAVLKRVTSNTEHQVTQFWESVEEGQDQTKLLPVILLADNVSSDTSQMSESDFCRRLYRLQMKNQLIRPIVILIHCDRTMKPKGPFSLQQKLTDKERNWMEHKYHALEECYPEGVGTFIAFLAMRHGYDQEKLQGAIVHYLDDNVLNENEKDLIEYVSLITAYYPSSGRFLGLPVSSCDTLMDTFRNEVAKPWEKLLSKVAGQILIFENCEDGYVVRIANKPYALAILETSLKQNDEALGDIVVRCLKSPLVRCKFSRKKVIDLLTQFLVEREFDVIAGDLTYMSPVIMKIKEADFDKAVEVLELGYKKLLMDKRRDKTIERENNEVFNHHLARLHSICDIDKAQRYAEKAVTLAPHMPYIKHTLGEIYLKQFNKKKETISDLLDGGAVCGLLHVAILAFNNFIEAQGETVDDALGTLFSCTQTIQTVNEILYFLSTAVSREVPYALYLTEDESDTCELFHDLQDSEQQVMKSLIEKGIEALRFLFYLTYSNSLGKCDATVRSLKDQRTINKATKDCDFQMKRFATRIGELRLNTFGIPDHENIKRKDNMLRFENVKLSGCFFESIGLHLKQLHSSRSEYKRETSKANLLKIKYNLESIVEKSLTDRDNLMTIYLALKIARLDNSFTLKKPQIYGYCNKVVHSKLDSSDTRKMRAHLYRVLVSWPQRYWVGFHEDEFRASFQYRSPPLWGRGKELVPKVHFYITKDPEHGGFHVCHWTEIYDDANKEPPLDVMSQRLQVFTGDYEVKKNKKGEDISIIIMKWKCPIGMLNLSIWKIRGEAVFREESVQFYLGFSLRGPVAIICRSMTEDQDASP